MSFDYPKNKHASLRTVAMPSDANPSGDIFGGWIMSQMDIAGASHAASISKSRVVTIAVEAMTFHLPVFVGDVVSCYCETKRIGRTSITVHIETWVLRNRVADKAIKVTEATFTFVALDNDRKPLCIKDSTKI